MPVLHSSWPPEGWPVVTRMYHSRHACAPLRVQGHTSMAVEDSDSFDLKRLPEGMRNPFRDINRTATLLICRGTRGGWGIPSEHKCRAVLTSVHTSAQTMRGTRVEAASRWTMVSRRGLVNDRDPLGSIRSLTHKRDTLLNRDN